MTSMTVVKSYRIGPLGSKSLTQSCCELIRLNVIIRFNNSNIKLWFACHLPGSKVTMSLTAVGSWHANTVRNGHLCERVRVRRFRELRGCGSACPPDSPAIRTIIVNVCGSRARELTPAKSVINHRWRREYVPTMPNNGYSESELRTISTLLALAAKFSKCFRMLSACKLFARRDEALVPPVSIQTLWKLRLYLVFLFLSSLLSCHSSLSPESSALFATALLVAFCFPRRFVKYSDAKERGGDIKFPHLRRENLICLCGRRCRRGRKEKQFVVHRARHVRVA